MADLLSLYQEKGDYYFSAQRDPLIELINRTGLRVLEVGCGVGTTSQRLLETGKAKWVTGIELVPERGEVARRALNEVHVGNIESMKLDWEISAFDCFVFGDVLEHLSDPWGLLRRLRPFLADDGIAVASIPNVKHLPVVSELILHDEWEYTECGVLDMTHLRFFTRKTAIRLFAQSGYAVDKTSPAFSGRRYSIPNQLTLGIFAGFLSQRWLLRCRAA